MQENNKWVYNRFSNFILTVVFPVTLVIVWQMSTSFGWVRQSVLPSPSGVWQSLTWLIERGIFWEDLIASLFRIFIGFIIGTVSGIIVGVLIGIFPKFDTFTKIIVGIFRPIPMIALIPFFILWFGIGEESKIAVIAIGTFWSLLLNTMEGIKGADQKLLEMSLMLQKSKWETIRYVIFPYAMPFIFTGIQIALTTSVSYVVTSEMIAAANGIGYRIMYARNLTQPGIMLVGVIEIGLLGAFNDLVMRKIQEKVFYYR